MDKGLVHLIKEINQIEYEINLRLIEEFSSLLNERINYKTSSIFKYYSKLNREDLLQLKDILSKLHSIISEEQEKNKRS